MHIHIDYWKVKANFSTYVRVDLGPIAYSFMKFTQNIQPPRLLGPKYLFNWHLRVYGLYFEFYTIELPHF